MVFVLANTGMLLKLLLEDVGVTFSDDELAIYETQFMRVNVSPRQFKNLSKSLNSL